MSTKSNIDITLDALNPSQSVRISGNDGVWVTAERSGDGIWLRFVRHTRDGFVVFRQTRF